MNKKHKILMKTGTVLIIYESELWQLPYEILIKAKKRAENEKKFVQLAQKCL